MRVALLPWGDVIEDFLDGIGVSFQEFCDSMTGGWLFGYVEALKAAGVETVLFCFSSQVSRVEHRKHRPTGAALCVIQGRRGCWIYRTTPFRVLKNEVARYRCSAVLCQEYEYPRFDWCVALGWMLKIPVYATFQGGDFQVSRIERFIRPWSLRACSGLIIGSAKERERVRRVYGFPIDRIAPILNPVDLSLWYPEDRDEARRSIGIASTTSVAIWHGRIDIRNKGLDTLLEAWRLVPNGELLLVGDGPDAGKLEALLQDIPRVAWKRQYTLDRAMLRRYLSSADLFVFPSRHEGFAVAPLEAMACGLPVVATENSGTREAGAVLVPANDPSGFAKQITGLLNDIPRCRDLGQSARLHIESSFALRVVGRQLREFLQQRATEGPAAGCNVPIL